MKNKKNFEKKNKIKIKESKRKKEEKKKKKLKKQKRTFIYLRGIPWSECIRSEKK